MITSKLMLTQPIIGYRNARKIKNEYDGNDKTGLPDYNDRKGVSQDRGKIKLYERLLFYLLYTIRP